MPRSVPAPIAPSALPAPSGSVHFMLLPHPPPMPRLSHNKGYLSMPSACLDPSLPPSPLPPFPVSAVQFISCSSPSPPPMPRLSHNDHIEACPVHAWIRPCPSGSVYLMLLPPPPCPVQRFSSSHAPPPPPCPVYLLIIVFKHAQCMPRSVLAPIAPPALPAPSGSVHVMLLPPPPCPVYLMIKGI